MPDETLVRLNAPLSLLITVRSVCVASLRTRSFALGIAAPDGSVTVPERDDVSDWAPAKLQKHRAHATTRQDRILETNFARFKTASRSSFCSEQIRGRRSCTSQIVQFGFTSSPTCSQI